MKPILFLLFLFSYTFSFAQTDTIYFSNERTPTLLWKDAKYYTLNELKQNGEVTLFDIKTKQKSVQYQYIKDAKYDYLSANGSVIYFYSNGNMQYNGFYKDSEKVSIWKEFYESGKPKETIEYDPKLLVFGYNEKHLLSFYVLEYWDNLGNKSVEKGKGLYFYRDSLITFTVELKKGVPDGICRGSLSNRKFFEQYNKGELQQGEILDNNKKVIYDKLIEIPSFKGGLKSMYEFISLNLKYPASAQRYNKQGKVYIKFAIQKDNSISNVSILKGIYNDCDVEAERVIKLMGGNWNCGKVRGIKENIWFTMPISFVLE